MMNVKVKRHETPIYQDIDENRKRVALIQNKIIQLLAENNFGVIQENFDVEFSGSHSPYFNIQIRTVIGDLPDKETTK